MADQTAPGTGYRVPGTEAPVGAFSVPGPRSPVPDAARRHIGLRAWPPREQMMAKKLMKGCEAIGEAAIRAGCQLFFGYPITPQNEIPEYMARRLPEVGGAFVQAESEVAASNMVYGAAGTGERVFTSSSSPGISLMQEAISYIAGSELPVVIVNIMRAGPGLGGILPARATTSRRPRAAATATTAAGAGAVVGAGGGRPRAGRLRPGRPVPQPGHGPRRRHDRPDDGAGRVPGGHGSRAGRCRPRTGPRPARRRPAAQHHQLALPRPRGARAPQPEAHRQVRGDGAGRGALRGVPVPTATTTC